MKFQECWRELFEVLRGGEELADLLRRVRDPLTVLEFVDVHRVYGFDPRFEDSLPGSFRKGCFRRAHCKCPITDILYTASSDKAIILYISVAKSLV